MTTLIQPGDWVHASNSREFDLSSTGAVGAFLRKWTAHTGTVYYVVGPKLESYAYGSYRHIRRITKAEGREIKKAYAESSRERWEHRNSGKSIGDEIREFLRNHGAGVGELVGSSEADGTGLRLSGIILDLPQL